MRMLPLAAALLLVPAAAAHAADLHEPETNQGATQVTVQGTRVESEAWAKALGHAVDAIVVARLVQQPEGPPRVETYERWTLDGVTKGQRGDKALGKQWETLLWQVLEEGVQGSKPRRKAKELMQRVEQHLPAAGQARAGAWFVGWSLGKGVSEGGGRRSVGRVALFTLTPAEPQPVTPREPPGARPVTPGSKGGAREEPKGGAQPRPAPPVTPGGGATPPPTPRVPPARRGPSAGSAAGRASACAEGSASSESGVRKHARMAVDLAALLPAPAPVPPEPKPPTTPRSR